MNHVADIYDVGTRSKSCYDIRWKGRNERWQAKNTITGKLFKCKLTDGQDRELAILKYNVFKSIVVPHYGIFVEGTKVTEVRKKISLGFEFLATGSNYEIKDDGYGEKWGIYQNGVQVAEVQAVHSNESQMHYQVVADERNRLIAVCICIAIDMAMRVLTRSKKR